MGGLLKDGQLCEEMVSTRSLSVHHPFGGIGGQARYTLAFSSMSPKMCFHQGIHLIMYLWGIIGKRVWQALTCFIVTVAKKWSMVLWCTSSILNHVRTTDTDLLVNDMIGMEGILLTSWMTKMFCIWRWRIVQWIVLRTGNYIDFNNMSPDYKHIWMGCFPSNCISMKYYKHECQSKEVALGNNHYFCYFICRSTLLFTIKLLIGLFQSY